MQKIELKKRINDVFGSQIAFAHHMRIDDGYVSKVLNGWKPLSREKQAQWAEALNSTPEELFKKD